MSEQAGEQDRGLVPRIYVASLSDYNAGRLHGVWMEAAQDPEGLHDQIDRMLQASPTPGAEEWAIHDYEGFGNFQVPEYEALEWVSAVATGIAEHGGAFAAFAAFVNDEPEGLKQFEEAYRGHWDSLTDYAESLLDDLGATEVLEQVPEWLQPYVELDSAGFARDLELGGDIRAVEGDGGVWIFDGRV